MAEWEHAYKGLIPPNAFVGGYENDGRHLYICRAHHNGDIIPGKAVASECAYVCYRGGEYTKDHFEVLVGNKYRWIRSENGERVRNAVIGGRTGQGEELYIGRVRLDNSLTPGKVHRSHRSLYIPYAGGERNFSQYEILVHVV